MHTEGRPREDIGEAAMSSKRERSQEETQPRGQHDLGLLASRIMRQ